MQVIEIVGYAGSVLIAVSLMMSSVVKLRLINFAGALVFSIYGFIIGALPVGILNGFIALVDAYYIYDIFSSKDLFKILEVHYFSEYLKYFLKYHEKEIEKFFPSFIFDPNEKWGVLFVLRNEILAGLVCTERISETSLYIKLDYAIPGYRDFKLGQYVYKKFFKEAGIKKIYTDFGSVEHNAYLHKMGYTESEFDGKRVLLLRIKEN